MSSVFATTLATLSFVNLVLLLGVARRLNRLTAAAPAAEQLASPLPRPGTPIGSFITATTEGERLNTKDLTGHLLVGFFTTNCPPCERFTPGFCSLAGTFAGGRDNVLAIIVGGSGDPAALARELDDVARVVVEPQGGPVSTAFAVDAFPAACLLRDGVITAADFDLESLTPAVEAQRPQSSTGS
jgi:thiol-disulfide isomerase/thioredoxin